MFPHLSFQQTSKRIASFKLISYFCAKLSSYIFRETRRGEKRKIIGSEVLFLPLLFSWLILFLCIQILRNAQDDTITSNYFAVPLTLNRSGKSSVLLYTLNDLLK